MELNLELLDDIVASAGSSRAFSAAESPFVAAHLVNAVQSIADGKALLPSSKRLLERALAGFRHGIQLDAAEIESLSDLDAAIDQWPVATNIAILNPTTQLDSRPELPGI